MPRLSTAAIGAKNGEGWSSRSAAIHHATPAATPDWTTCQPFDRSRAWLSDTVIFQPFRVTSSFPLRDALARKQVEGETNLLVIEQGKTRLALITSQMAYHHVAQGEIAGEPWMVSF